MQASNGELRLTVRLPEGHHLTKGANSRFEIQTQQPGAIAFEPASGSLVDDRGTALAEVHFRRSDAAEVQVDAKVYYCLDGGVCLFEQLVFQIPFASVCQGRQNIDLNYNMPPRNGPDTLQADF